MIEQIIVVDGGSVDDTVALAEAVGAAVLKSEPGRGVQLAKGAENATGSWLLVLHADSLLTRGWTEVAQEFIKADHEQQKAGYFRLKFDDESRAARRLERIVRWRARWLGLPYGDQGLLISRAHYQRLGGFEPVPLMEDVKLVRQIGRRNLVALDAEIVTSARRYRGGYLKRALRNAMILMLYFAGVTPERLARMYS